MPQYVTPIVTPRRASPRPRMSGASVRDVTLDEHAYRRRLAGLRMPAPDTLRDRVRRELRACIPATPTRAE